MSLVAFVRSVFADEGDAGDLDDGRTLACECKWSLAPVSVAVYYELMRKVSLLPPPRGTGLVRCALFSAARFDENMVETAARDDMILIWGEDLLETTGQVA